jgi:hypothetical protein
MKKMQEESKRYNIQDKTSTPPQTKPYIWQTLISQLKKAAIKIRGLSKAKDHTPPEAKVIKQASHQTKATQIKRQTQTTK